MNPITKHFLLSVSRCLMAFGLVIFVVCLASVLSPAEAAEGAPTVTMQSALVEIIQQVQTGVQSGVAFLKQELPDVVRQLIVFNIVFKLFAVVGGVLLWVSAGIYWWVAKYKATKRGEAYLGEDVCLLGGIFTFIALLSGAIFFFANIEGLFKLWLAPKVWLIEYAATLVK